MLPAPISVLFLQLAAAGSIDQKPPEVVEVRSAPAQQQKAALPGLSSIDMTQITLLSPAHPHALFDRVPGAWVVQGSGQEHLSAIRSPVLTGPGACGAFLLMENGVPVRPSGFCNVNGMLELNLLQASRVDVLRGPGTVIYGSDALHGAVDVIASQPAAGAALGVEAGSHDFYRGRFSLSSDSLAVYGNYTDAGSFRDHENYTHALGNLAWTAQVGEARVSTLLSYADLEQNTAGFILGKDAYKDSALRRENLNPEAYRNADAVRLSSRWQWAPSPAQTIELTPYLRHSGMTFLQHFLPGQPQENNSQDSAGLQFSWQKNRRWSAGADLEWARGQLREYQAEPLTDRSAYLNATRPQGLHYDYTVKMLRGAVWAQYQVPVNDAVRANAGMRVESQRYDYNNHMLDGNTRDDGSQCGFGGCLYTRPGDRTDTFTNLSPELGLKWRLSDRQTLYTRLARGFRAPQATELYRLQSGQSVADLHSESLASLEVGLKGFSQQLNYDITAYAMHKKHFIFRDANGFNVSDGKSHHLGIEADMDWQVDMHWSVNANLSWARHRYAFTRVVSQGESIASGNEMDTAPSWLGGLRLDWRSGPGRMVEAEWVYQGDYYLDAANLHRYPGHSLFNLRTRWQIGSGSHSLALTLTNLLDTRYADRADFAFGNYRYFPGAGRQFRLEWQYRG